MCSHAVLDVSPGPEHTAGPRSVHLSPSPLWIPTVRKLLDHNNISSFCFFPTQDGGGVFRCFVLTVKSNVLLYELKIRSMISSFHMVIGCYCDVRCYWRSWNVFVLINVFFFFFFTTSKSGETFFIPVLMLDLG